jgi:chemotaxis receptor (MCP) glutamine deamidase CheD
MPALNYAVIPGGGNWVKIGVNSVGFSRRDKLFTIGLFNCLGFVLNDHVRSVGAIAHLSPGVDLDYTLRFMERGLVNVLGATRPNIEVLIAGGMARTAAEYTAINGYLAAMNISHTVHDATYGQATVARPATWVRGEGARGLCYAPVTGAVELLNYDPPANIGGEPAIELTLIFAAIP